MHFRVNEVMPVASHTVTRGLPALRLGLTTILSCQLPALQLGAWASHLNKTSLYPFLSSNMRVMDVASKIHSRKVVRTTSAWIRAMRCNARGCTDHGRNMCA